MTILFTKEIIIIIIICCGKHKSYFFFLKKINSYFLFSVLLTKMLLLSPILKILNKREKCCKKVYQKSYNFLFKKDKMLLPCLVWFKIKIMKLKN